VKAIVGVIFNQDSTRALLENKVRVFRSLMIHYSIVDKSQLSIVEISWLTSKVEETFSAAEIITKTDELVDIPQLRLLSSQDSVYNSEIAHIEYNLKELYSNDLELELKKNEILK